MGKPRVQCIVHWLCVGGRQGKPTYCLPLRAVCHLFGCCERSVQLEILFTGTHTAKELQTDKWKKLQEVATDRRAYIATDSYITTDSYIATDRRVNIPMGHEKAEEEEV